MYHRIMTDADLPAVAARYAAYYNAEEGGCWTAEKARKRIHQVMTMEDSMCLVQLDESGEPTGFLMGFFQEYDDIRGYHLDEIVIFSGHQNQGCGTELMREMERRILENGAVHIGLDSVSDPKHLHFYRKLGYDAASNFTMMCKFLG